MVRLWVGFGLAVWVATWVCGGAASSSFARWLGVDSIILQVQISGHLLVTRSPGQDVVAVECLQMIVLADGASFGDCPTPLCPGADT